MIRARQSGHPGDFVIRRQLTFVAILMPEKTCRTRSLPQRQYDRLFIESPPMPHPNLAGKVVRVIVIWERDT